jgi:hypothetical protein
MRLVAGATRGTLTADRVGMTFAGLWFVTANYGPVSGAGVVLGEVQCANRRLRSNCPRARGDGAIPPTAVLLALAGTLPIA